MNIELKPNTAIVSVLETVNLYDLLFRKKDDTPKVLGLQSAAQYSKIKILKLSSQTENDKNHVQLKLNEGDICIIAKSVISVVNEETDIKLGFVDTQNIIAKISE